jgi:hypothetical protein
MGEVDVAFEPDPAPVCGDGRATSARTRCFRRCSRGCGTDRCGEVECEDAGERCDGPDLGAWSCADNGYAGGTLGCDASCELDWSECLSCIEGPGLRCRSAPYRGSPDLYPIPVRGAVLIVSRDDSGDVTAARVSADLRLRALPPLARRTRAMATWGSRVAVLTHDGALRAIDVETRAARTLATGLPEGEALILPQTGGTGIAVITAWDQHGLTRLHAFEADGTPMPSSRAAHFGQRGVRFVTVPVREAAPESRVPGGLQPGDRIVGYGRGGHSAIFFARGDAPLQYVASIDTYEWPGGSVRVGWRDQRGADGYTLAGEDPVEHVEPAPLVAEAPGLSELARAGAEVISAFDGTLGFNAREREGRLTIFHVRAP